MRTEKKVLSILLVAMMIICGLPGQAFATSNGSDSFDLYINPYGNEQNSFDTIKWYYSLGKYYLFLPEGCDKSALTVYFDTQEIITINKRRIVSGETTDIFSRADDFVVRCGSKLYNLTVMQSANIPAMFIRTDEPLSYIHESKDNKSSGSIRTYEGGKQTLDVSFKQLKGRGNSTWNYDKKPYNIKFNDKISLLGMPKAKKWCLLASYIDPAIIKNPLGWELSNQLGLSYASEYRFVDLYINGEYMGNYIICESVEIGENRIDITDLAKLTEKANKGIDIETCPIIGSEFDDQSGEKTFYSRAKWVDIPNNPDDITGGYLLECEYYSRAGDEISEFFTSRGQLMVVKEPEYASEAQVKYISNYWQEAEDAICSPDGYNELGKHYSDYFDMDALVDMYILMEFSGNADAGVSSTFFYKDQGGKLVAGPIWDNDTAFGNIAVRGCVLVNDPSLWIASRMNYSCFSTMPTGDEYPTIYNRLCQRQDFRDLVCHRWKELRGIFNKQNVLELINSLSDTLEESAIMNGIRWYGIFSKELYTAAVDMSRTYLANRICWLNKGFGSNSANLYYDSNGGTGWTMENKIMQNGQYVVVNEPYNSDLTKLPHISSMSEIADVLVRSIKPPTDDMVFAGWNTAEDGSGRTYQPGDLLKMNGTTVLYAQWRPSSSQERQTNDCALLRDNPLYDFGRSLRNVSAMYCSNLCCRLSNSAND